MSRLICPPDPTTPSGTGASRGEPRAIPDDLLQEASQRLGVIALMGAVLWLTGAGLWHFAERAMVPGDPDWRQLGFPDAVSLGAILVSLGLFGYARRSKREPRFMLDLGLAYLVLTSFAIALVWHWDVERMGWTAQPMITWVGVVILMFAAVIPNPPGKTLVVGLIAASMNPVGMLIAGARGAWDFGPSSNVLLMHYPDYLMVGISVVISKVVTRMGHHVSRARELGSYHVGELLGRGGMGEVFRATHRLLAREAAIKLIRPEILAGADPASVQLAITRFKREAEVAASLRSPHTVELYDFGVTEDQALYFVMEMLDGLDLERLVRRFGAIPPGRAVYLLDQVCESLEEAHVRGLVHRDIKPSNIHVGRLGLRHDFVKVLDFGLVKQVNGKGDGQTGATAEGIIPGTPDYMAPEMTMNRGIDGRTDLYAVGCVAYYMLTARPVFEAANVFHMISRHLNDIPVPPSQVATQPIPPELEQVVLACLAKSPDERPRSATELARALEAVPAEPWGETQAAEWWRTHPAA